MLPCHSSVVKKKTSVSVAKRTEVLYHAESGMCPCVLVKILHSVFRAWLSSLGAGASEETEGQELSHPSSLFTSACGHWGRELVKCSFLSSLSTMKHVSLPLCPKSLLMTMCGLVW